MKLKKGLIDLYILTLNLVLTSYICNHSLIYLSKTKNSKNNKNKGIDKGEKKSSYAC